LLSTSFTDLVEKSDLVQVPSVKSVDIDLEVLTFPSSTRSLCFFSTTVEAAATAQLTLNNPFCYTTNPFTTPRHKFVSRQYCTSVNPPTQREKGHLCCKMQHGIRGLERLNPFPSKHLSNITLGNMLCHKVQLRI
jgi:hypothetical protein